MKSLHISEVGDDGNEMIKQLKEKFHETEEKSVKIQILTPLPMSWTIKKIENEFKASNYVVHKAKSLVKSKGILSLPNPNQGHSLGNDTIVLVQNFYESGEISRIMPGKKDCVSIKVNGTRISVQKRLLLGSLKEIYQQFKDQFPVEKIGFSRFAELRPKHCVLAGASGTHAVCVCTIHQNTKLMMIGGKLEEVTANREVHLKHYNHCIALVICNPPLPACYLRICQYCPGISKLKDYLNEVMDDNYIDSIQYKQWVSVDISTLETITRPADDFVDSFCDQIKLLIPHSFIAKQQSLFQTDAMSSLLPGQFIVIHDFSENYTFVLQDAAQGFHWNNSQATIHPFVAYYRQSGKLEHVTAMSLYLTACIMTQSLYIYSRRIWCNSFKINFQE